jgi:hypothetical protein
VDEEVFLLSWRAEEIGGGKDQKSGIYDKAVASQHQSILQCAIDAVRGEQGAMDVESSSFPALL